MWCKFLNLFVLWCLCRAETGKKITYWCLKGNILDDFYEIWVNCLRIFFVVALLFYVHGKHLRSCRDGQLT